MTMYRRAVCATCRRVGSRCEHPKVVVGTKWRAPRRSNDAAWQRIAAGEVLWDRKAIDAKSSSEVARRGRIREARRTHLDVTTIREIRRIVKRCGGSLHHPARLKVTLTVPGADHLADTDLARLVDLLVRLGDDVPFVVRVKGEGAERLLNVLPAERAVRWATQPVVTIKPRPNGRVRHG